MKYWFLVLILVVGCTKAGQNHTAPSNVPLASNSETTHTPKFIDYEIADYKEEVNLDPKTEFGKFHNDRLTIHIIDNPQETLFSHPTKSLTLYFIDSVLCKKKYELGIDISSDLMTSYGSFSFKPLDWNTRDLAKDNGVLVTQEKKKSINPQLKKYRMKWTLEDKDILFSHEEDTIREINVYEELLPEYKLLIKLVENGLI